MPASGAVTRSTLRQQIADALREEVLAGRLGPGEVFTVRQIAEQYGVSATPVREALVDLTAQGLLDCDQHRGFRVHRFSVEDYRGMVEARALVVDGVFRKLGAPGADRGAAAVPPPARSPEAASTGGGGSAGPGGGVRREIVTAPPYGARLVSVRRRGEEAARAARAGELDILIGYDLRFWRELSGFVANAYIVDFLHRLRVQAWVFAVPHLRADPRGERWLWSGHEELVAAVTLADPDAVGSVMDAYNAHALRWADHLDALGRAGR
ncbi:GntR family transcriptional regulator [Streptomyces solincola]|uniref:GntR family transcriptional regulator n=1 Tax=Streptomyces solincola TaxID=2100817 RepID=A0A2S9PP06_9ACTN|nr:GntR family transcriptional regulator [Streptomyces solincola]PRH76132.1 GntR family transcriptional regulator [Streptomyces solincola]